MTTLGKFDVTLSIQMMKEWVFSQIGFWKTRNAKKMGKNIILRTVNELEFVEKKFPKCWS